MKKFILFFLFLALAAPLRSQRPSEIAELLRDAAASLQAGDSKKAEAILLSVKRKAPMNADANNMLGILSDQKGDFKKAEGFYRASLKANPKALSPLANLGILLAKTNRPEEAAKTFEAVLIIRPGHPQAIINLGILRVSLAEFEKAIPLLRKADSIQPGDYDILYHLGLSLYKTKSFAEAKEVLENCRRLSPKRPEPPYFLGMISFEQTRDEEAFALFNDSISANPGYAPAHFMAAEVFARNKQFGKAIEPMAMASSLDKENYRYRARLGALHMLNGDFKMALSIFETAAKDFPKNPEFQYFIAVSHRGLGNSEASIAALKKALFLDPAHSDSLTVLGSIKLDRGEFKEAESLLRKAILINKESFIARFDLGRLLVKTRRFTESLVVLNEAAKINPENPDIRYQLFLAYSNLKMKKEADAELASFKALSKSH